MIIKNSSGQEVAQNPQSIKFPSDFSLSESEGEVTIDKSPSGVQTADIADDAVTSAKLDQTTIQYAEVAISIAEMKAIRATPKALVAAPGAGYVTEFVSAVFIYDYAAVYTESADNLAIRYTDGSGTVVSLTLETTGLLDATADKISGISRLATDVLMTANAALVLHNTGDGEFGGTGSPCRVKVAYRVHPTGL